MADQANATCKIKGCKVALTSSKRNLSFYEILTAPNPQSTCNTAYEASAVASLESAFSSPGEGSNL